ncbi:methionyl-tRNA formyltransferase [Ignavibacteria bacterium]|nr:methionyl-tRNA formyltransferase [Bacteroidota bacterium]
MNLIFMGTPEFAVPALETLHKEFSIKAVVTIPDKPAGRGLKLQPSAVKTAAISLGIPVLQPVSLRNVEFQAELAALQPDIICVIAFRILPASVYSLARLGTFNVHASLLPKFRGAAPIQRAIMAGETESGVTSFLLNDIVDSGNIVLRKSIAIPDGMTAGELYAALMPLAAQAAADTCCALWAGVQPEPQNNEQATPAPKVFREQCEIDWTKSACEIRNFIHGVSPVPGAWTMLDGKRFKIYRCAIADVQNENSAQSGEFDMSSDGFRVSCGTGALFLLQIQPEGKPIMSTEEFMRGRQRGRQGRFGV